jgi:hypothetical protein
MPEQKQGQSQANKDKEGETIEALVPRSEAEATDPARVLATCSKILHES